MGARNRTNEIRLTRVYDAPVRAVWDAWTVPEQVEKWWGPRGFTLTTHAKDLRAGGTWRYTMHGPDGVDYPNVTRYLMVEPYAKLVYDHGATDDRPALFRVTVTFAETNGRTTMEMTSTLPSPEAAAEMARFIKQAGGDATWDRLAEHLDENATGKRRFVISHAFEAPRARVFDLWSTPERLARWRSPAATDARIVGPGHGPDADTATSAGARGGPATERPHRLVCTHRHVDDGPQRASEAGPGAGTLHTTVVFVEESPDRTRVTVTSEPFAPTAPADLDAFAHRRGRMTLAWDAAFDALEAQLDGSSNGG